MRLFSQTRLLRHRALLLTVYASGDLSHRRVDGEPRFHRREPGVRRHDDRVPVSPLMLIRLPQQDTKCSAHAWAAESRATTLATSVSSTALPRRRCLPPLSGRDALARRVSLSEVRRQRWAAADHPPCLGLPLLPPLFPVTQPIISVSSRTRNRPRLLNRRMPCQPFASPNNYSIFLRQRCES